ncbi:MAG TPA: tripartite tricarboxylate transporter TctB family protein [Burkholderiales bacterium]|nr:tripartite tricarboxylate transporter TctB family protein [Burkholderiales bacterium]
MHKKASLVLSVVVMIASGYGVVAATAWPWKAALFPLVIGVPLFCLAAAEALWTLFGSAASAADAMDFQLATGDDSWRRTALAVGWMLGFFAAIVLLGFPIAVPLFMVLYLKMQGREAWLLTIAMTLAVWGVFYGLFVYLLHLPFPSGWVFEWFAS